MSGPRIVWRDSDGKYHDEAGDGRRAYGDFRAYRVEGGTREALKAPGEGWATTDPETAATLFSDRLREYEAKRKGRVSGRQEKTPIGLKRLAALHLRMKNKAGNTSESHMKDLEQRLRVAVKHFGADRDPATITPADVRVYLDWLSERKSHKGGTLKPTTVRGYMWALSGLFERAREQQYASDNPVRLLQEKPTAKPSKRTDFFEVAEAALILEAAKVVEARGKSVDGLHPIIATFLLTGGRRSEVLGLDVEDVSFDRGKIEFRPNDHRPLKTSTSHRSVPIWPQLRDILQRYMYGGDAPRASGLLFPAPNGGMIRDMYDALDSIGEVCGLGPKAVRFHMLRHTYASARLQTVDRIKRPGFAGPLTLEDGSPNPDAFEWVPVTPFQVAKELGHGGHGLVERIYGHASDNPHRSEVVEYRTEQHREQLGERLKAVEAALSG